MKFSSKIGKSVPQNRSVIQKKHQVCSTLFLLLCLLCFSAVSAPAAAASDSFSVNLNEIDTIPDGAVFLIIDGLGSYYMFPELKGETLTGESVQKASVPVLSKIWDNGFRISEMIVPVPVTEKGHSVLVTGNPAADSETVGYTDSTFMDILRQEGFICIGIMQRGDFESMRGKFDVIIYDKTNSVNNMDFSIQTNQFNDSDSRIIREIESVFISRQKSAASYTNTKDTGEKYAGYNRWGLDTAVDVLSVMEKYPGQKFILVINVGAVDSTGHYRGYYAYLDAVEKLDRDLEKLFEKCRRNNLFFIFTADHGMSFEAQDKKSGGHSSTKYAKTKEALSIPFIIYGNNILKGTVYSGQTGQEDAAVTLLSLFNINEPPRFSKGNVLPAKEKASFYLLSPEPVHIQLYQLTGGGETAVFNSLGFSRNDGFSDYSISGLSQGSYLLKWETVSSKDSFAQNELRFQIMADTTLDLSDYSKKYAASVFSSDGGAQTAKKTGFSIKLPKAGYFLLIGIVNIIGVGIIYSIYKKRDFFE